MIVGNKNQVHTSPSVLVSDMDNLNMNENKSHPFHVHDTSPRRRQEEHDHRRVFSHDNSNRNTVMTQSPLREHRKAQSMRAQSTAMNPFEDPSLVGELAHVAGTHRSNPSDASSVLSNFDPYSAHTSPTNNQERNVKSFDLPKHSMDPAKLASIAAALSEAMPQTEEARPKTLQKRTSSSGHRRVNSRGKSGSIRNLFSSSSRRSSAASVDNGSPSRREDSSPLRTSLRNSQKPLYRSELDPSPHQVNMPTQNFCLITARLTQWANHVQNVLKGQGLKELVGLSHLALQQKEGPAATFLKDCGIDDIQLLHAAADCMVLCSDTKRLIWVVCNQSNEFDAAPLLEPILRNHYFFDVCFTGFRTRTPITTSMKFAQDRSDVLISCLTISTPKSQDASSIRHLAHSLPNYRLIRLEHVSEQQPSSPSAVHLGHSIVLGGPVTRAYLFDKNKRNNKNVFNKINKAKPPLDLFVTSLEHIAHMGLPWPREFEGAAQQDSKHIVC